MKTLAHIFASAVLLLSTSACSNDTIGYDEPEPVPAQTDGGYLFAFMTNAKYGKLFYALSRDGFNWETLNKTRIVDNSYTGHPDFIQGRDGAYYGIAIEPLALWRTEDFVDWTKTPLDTDIINAANAQGFYVTRYYGAPKMFFDKESDQYIITWHACLVEGIDDWDSMTTLYVLTKDFQTFTEPRRLFSFTDDDADISTIDTIIRKVGDTYYAIFKDERSVDNAPLTGKNIRISTSSSLTGPYSQPGQAIIPQAADQWHEAPIFVERPGGAGYAIYAESYNNSPWGYDMYVSSTMKTDGYWAPRSFQAPTVRDNTSRPGARHGCIVRIPENVYQAVHTAYSQN